MPLVVSEKVNSYQEVIENYKKIDNSNYTIELDYTAMALYAPVAHAIQAIGVVISRLFGANIVIQCYSARIITFLFSVFLIYFSLKIVPIKKEFFLAIALLPITLNEIASTSADAIIISTTILFICYILYLVYDVNKKNINIFDILILSILSFFIALCKIVYIPLVLLLFLLPKDKFRNTKTKYIVVISIFLVASFLNLLWLNYATRYLIEFQEGVNSKEQAIFVITNPIKYTYIMVKTIIKNFRANVNGLCGKGISMLSADTSSIFVFSEIILMIYLVLFEYNEYEIHVNKIVRIICIFVFCTIIVLIYTSIYVQWTSLKSGYIKGIQPRYFIPILPLSSIFLLNYKFKKKVELKYIATLITFIDLNALIAIFVEYL